MEWTARQREQIILYYAHDGVVFCPDDLEPLSLVPEHAADAGRRGVTLYCPMCGKRTHSPTVPLGIVQSPMAPG